MKKSFFLIIFMCFVGMSFSQIVSDTKIVDFGAIERSTNRVVDIKLTNKGDKDSFMLRSTFSFEYSFLFSSKTISPDSTVTLRVKYNPRSKGDFKETIELYFTTESKPVKIVFKGDVEYIDNSENTACPSFRDNPVDCCDGNEMMVIVRNALTLEPIEDARFRLISMGQVVGASKTDKKGTIVGEVPIQYYYMTVDAEGFRSQDSSSYVNRRANYFEFFLDPMDELELLSQQKPTLPQKEIEQKIEGEIGTLVEIETIDYTEEEPLNDGLLSIDEYRPNNIVFLIDVSQSMNQKGRLEILKASMLELLGVLRDIDQVAIVTYASEVKVVMDVQKASDKFEIAAVIQSLEAGGMTAGAKGFKGAYELGRDHFIENGNNQVIVATDGAFREKDNARILKMVDDYLEKEISTSVVGIKSNSYTTKILSEIAAQGYGSYIPVEDFDQSKVVLIDEIKKQSRIGE